MRRGLFVPVAAVSIVWAYGVWFADSPDRDPVVRELRAKLEAEVAHPNVDCDDQAGLRAAFSDMNRDLLRLRCRDGSD